jgi:hypothetical protein
LASAYVSSASGSRHRGEPDVARKRSRRTSSLDRQRGPGACLIECLGERRTAHDFLCASTHLGLSLTTICQFGKSDQLHTSPGTDGSISPIVHENLHHAGQAHKAA